MKGLGLVKETKIERLPVPWVAPEVLSSGAHPLLILLTGVPAPTEKHRA